MPTQATTSVAPPLVAPLPDDELGVTPGRLVARYDGGDPVVDGKTDVLVHRSAGQRVWVSARR